MSPGQSAGCVCLARWHSLHLHDAAHDHVPHGGNVATRQRVHQHELVPALHKATAAGYQAATTKERAMTAQHALQRLCLNDITNTHALHGKMPADGQCGRAFEG